MRYIFAWIEQVNFIPLAWFFVIITTNLAGWDIWEYHWGMWVIFGISVFHMLLVAYQIFKRRKLYRNEDIS